MRHCETYQAVLVQAHYIYVRVVNKEDRRLFLVINLLMPRLGLYSTLVKIIVNVRTRNKMRHRFPLKLFLHTLHIVSARIPSQKRWHAFIRIIQET